MDFSKLPKIDRILEAEELGEVRAALGHRALLVLARDAVARARERVQSGQPAPEFADVVAEVSRLARGRLEATLEPVINATGVLLHTNLGRAPLPEASIANVARTAGGYSTLEFDAALGTRTRRGLAVERSLAELTGSEDALLVNNNAAAVLLSLSSLAAGHEVVVSRGELVEIGGGFRIPEVLARSGARLVEVGTTNRTRIDDYARAVSERTACLLRVHPSNFKISGFAERPTREELVRLARERKIPLVKDLGGGLVVELPPVLASSDLAHEPTVQACLRSGVDLVCFSLDKLFGGPQGGAIVGRADLVQRLREDPLARALRVDKLTLAALEPILAAYHRGAVAEIPLHALLATPLESLEQRVAAWRIALGAFAGDTEIVRTEGAIGGGTLAEAPVASVALRIRGRDPERLAKALRNGRPCVVGRIFEDGVFLDARTVFPAQDADLAATLRRVLSEPSVGLDGAPDP